MAAQYDVDEHLEHYARFKYFRFLFFRLWRERNDSKCSAAIIVMLIYSTTMFLYLAANCNDFRAFVTLHQVVLVIADIICRVNVKACS